MWMLWGVAACTLTVDESDWTEETPIEELSFAEQEEVCEEQLERAQELKATECDGVPVPLAVSQGECTDVLLTLLESCGLSVGDFDACVSELLVDECALFQVPPPPGCAPMVECLYQPE
jgi:hypothetical protein